MLSSGSKRSVHSARFEKSLEGWTERSPFQRCLPMAAEELAVSIPTRGGPHSTWCSPRMPKVRNRKYVLKVEPGPRQDNDWMLPPAIARAYEAGDERFGFRSERAGRFQLGRHFPALVAAPELLPSWRLAQTSEWGRSPIPAAPCGERDAALPADFARTTESAWRRQRPKQTDVGRKGFMGTSSDSSRLICDRGPALFAEPYDAALEVERKADQRRKARMRGEATVLTSAAAARVSCDSFRPDVDNHIATMRGRGRIMNELLRGRYEKKRDTFRQNREARLRQSNFQRSLREKEEAAAEEARRREIAEQEAAAVARSRSDAIPSDLQLTISLGR